MSWRSPIVACLLAALGMAACGDISNEDLLFKAALPDDALQVSPPDDSGVSSQGLGDDWALQTSLGRAVSNRLNIVVNQVLDHVSTITARTPGVRRTGYREWKAVRIAKTGLYARMTMTTSADVQCEVSFSALPSGTPGYRWSVEISGQKDQGFVEFISGASRGLDFSHSCGNVSVKVAALRTLGVDLGEPALLPVQAVDESWERDGAEQLLKLHVTSDGADSNLLDDKVSYFFRRHTDSSGVFQFVLRDDVRGRGTERLQAILQWDVSSRPWRADFCVDVPGALRPDCGTACGPETHDRTYLEDDVGTGHVVGSPTACGKLQAEDPRTPLQG